MRASHTQHMTLQTGARLGVYEIRGPLGSGGMGEVYLAWDGRLGREVAVEVLPESAAGNPDRLRRFEQEAKAAGALNHPNVLAVYDVGTHESLPYLVSARLAEAERVEHLVDEDGVLLRRRQERERPQADRDRGGADPRERQLPAAAPVPARAALEHEPVELLLCRAAGRAQHEIVRARAARWCGGRASSRCGPETTSWAGTRGAR